MPDVLLFLAQLLTILVATQLVGRLLRGVGQPRVIGEMVAGIALGPSLLGAIAPAALARLFPPDALLPIGTLSQLGVILFMFVVGLRLDTAAVRERIPSAVLVSHASIVVPFVLGGALGLWLHPHLAPAGVHLLPFVLFLGAAMSVTAFPVLARILAERNLVGTRLGSIATACAAVDDVTAWCLLAAVIAIARAGSGIAPFVTSLAGTAAYALVIVTIGRRALRSWDRTRAQRGRGAVSSEIVAAAVILALLSALVTEWLGVHALFGAFLAGAIVPRGSGLAEGIADRLEDVVGTVLLPVFFAFTGLRTEIGLVHGAELWAMFAAVLAVAVLGKLGGSAVAAHVTGLEWKEALAIGVLMNTRGLMELVILNVGLEIGVISRPLFAMMVLMALVTTIMTSPVLERILRSEPVTSAMSRN